MSTDYRNLRLFKKLGLVDEHYFNGCCRYEAKTKPEHHHLICLACGRIIDFDYRLGPEMAECAETKYRFHTTGVEVGVVGHCADCLAKKGEVISSPPRSIKAECGKN